MVNEKALVRAWLLIQYSGDISILSEPWCIRVARKVMKNEFRDFWVRLRWKFQRPKLDVLLWLTFRKTHEKYMMIESVDVYRSKVLWSHGRLQSSRHELHVAKWYRQIYLWNSSETVFSEYRFKLMQRRRASVERWCVNERRELRVCISHMRYVT